jgi:hypothetical protein
MAGLWRPRQRRGCRGVSHDGAVASRAGIIRHAVRLVEFLAPSCVHVSLARLRTSPAAPLPRTHTERRLCGAVLMGGGSERDFCLTRP